MSTIFQNLYHTRTDREVYKCDLALGELAEPLGFESVWAVEHHFTGYTMCPDVLQYLSYMAGRTKTVKLGSMVLVLPWHDPLRAAEEIAMLDHLSNGRVILGIGRGAGKVEFDAFRLDMGESRQRFVEAAEMVLEGLERGYCEYDGKFYKQPKAAIRPEPFKTFRDRTYAAAVSPESAHIMAKLGIGMLIVPQRPWADHVKDLNDYRAIFRDINNTEAPQPIAVSWTFCDRDPDRAREMAERYIGGYFQTCIEHYQFDGDHMAKTKGYELYAQWQEAIRANGPGPACQAYMDQQVWGTPEMCFEKIREIHRKTDNSGFVGVFSYTDMEMEEAARNMTLFAKEVMPELKKMNTDRSAKHYDLAAE
jgi:alkanesulfonate monooxygenase SsuD/methylene tetrahydromethanopterin reductase-like flavin-dependent oxidoreductase (luciferase family)